MYVALVINKVPETWASYQAYVPPGAVAVSVAEEPGQILALAADGAKGNGLTVIEKLIGLPTQPPADGVTVIAPEIAVVPEFAAIKEGALPVPEADKPIVGFEFDQL